MGGGSTGGGHTFPPTKRFASCFPLASPCRSNLCGNSGRSKVRPIFQDEAWRYFAYLLYHLHLKVWLVAAVRSPAQTHPPTQHGA